MKTALRYTPEQLARLPKWAQSEIGILQRDLQYVKDQLKATAENLPTKVKLAPYSDTPRYLREHDAIEFTLRDGKFGKGEIEVKMQGDRLYIYANDPYNEELAFIPKSSNTGFLAFVPRGKD